MRVFAAIAGRGFGARLTLALLAGAGPGALAADEPWIGAAFAADARRVLAAAEAVPARGANVVVLYRDTAYRFDAEGRTTYRQHLLYRLLTPKAIEGWSKVEVDFAPWHQMRPEIRARVVTGDGREHWLEDSAVSEGPAPSDEPGIVADRRIVEAELPGIEVGAVVEEEVVVRDEEPFFAAGTAGAYPLQMFAPIHRGRFVLAAPTTLPLRYGVRLAPDLQPLQRLEGGFVELVFEYRDVPAAAPIQSGLPSHQPRLPQVSFSTGESWRAVASGYSRLVDEKIAGADLGVIAERLAPRPGAGPPGDVAARAAAILAEVHREVRYSGLELGASSLIPAAPDVTLERGFGDCKDQATLVVALLRREGIPAHVALLNAGFGRDVENRLPGIGRFDHAVVYVPTTPPIWIDPTDPAARVGELPAADQNRWALIAGPATEKLLRTPSANSIDNLTVEWREVVMADHGPGRIVEKSVYHGEQERQQRRIVESDSDESRRQGYWEYVESTYLAEELGEVMESDPADLSEPFSLTLEALRSSRAVTDLAEAVVAIRQEGLVASLPAALRGGGAPRTAPFVIDQPFVTEWHYRIETPAGFAPRELPGDEERALGTARYSRKVGREERAVTVDLRFDSGPRYLTPETFAETRAGVQALLAEEPLLLWFDHVGAAALNKGESREAIAQFRRLAELEPDRAIHRIRLSQALMRLGIAGESERQARLAVELDPESALAHWSLGYALEHDEVGRRFGAGFRRPAALEALERAVELDPEQPLARTELAILLEYDDQGRRYTGGADLDRAIAEYRILRDELGARNLEVNLISALFWASRWEELYVATLSLPDTPVSAYLQLVALAILRGPDAAIRESENLSSSLEEKLGLLNSAAQHLVIARRYIAAAALLRRAALDMGNPASLLARAEVLERTRRHEEIEVETGTPADLARSLLLIVRKDYDRAELSRFFHPRYLEDRGDRETALEATFNRMRQEQFQSVGDLPVAAVLDLAFSILDAEVDGSAALGFRVRLLNRMESSKVAYRVYVTPYEGRLVIAAIEVEYGQIGKEVWWRLDQDDLRGAHQWLDWARDSVEDVETDDPYGFRPFARFWTRGTGAFREKMRLGAAILMADQPEAAVAVPVLEEALAQASNERRRKVVEAALFQAYSQLDDEVKLGELAARLIEKEPASALAFVGRCQQLLAEGRLAELESLARDRLSRRPDSPEAFRCLVRAAAQASELERALGYFEERRDSDSLRVHDYNLWSWLLLFRDPIPEEAVELAELGAERSRFRDPAMLHTLATVYAETGRPAEAHATLVRSLELKDEPDPRGDDWYVLGRIAEEYGYDELARDDYARVGAAADGQAFSAADLIARRLSGSAAKGTAKRRVP